MSSEPPQPRPAAVPPAAATGNRWQALGLGLKREAAALGFEAGRLSPPCQAGRGSQLAPPARCKRWLAGRPSGATMTWMADPRRTARSRTLLSGVTACWRWG